MISRRDLLKLMTLAPLVYLGDGKNKPLPTAHANSNVLIVVFDTLSALHVSTFGYARDNTPNFERFAGQSTVFHNHYSTANFTVPSTTSLLTGTLPWTHGSFHLQPVVDDAFQHQNLFSIFGEYGYTQTAMSQNDLAIALLQQMNDPLENWRYPKAYQHISKMFTDTLVPKDYPVAHAAEMNLMLGKNPGLFYLYLMRSMYYELARSRYQHDLQGLFPAGAPYSNSFFFSLADALALAVEQVSTMREPFVGYYHMYPPHSPYSPEKEFYGRFHTDSFHSIQKPTHFFGESEKNRSEFLAPRCALYDEYIAYVDHEFGAFLDRLHQEGTLDNTILVLTSDHGEMFARGILEHTTPVLYESLVHIPLFIRLPGQTQRVDIQQNTSNIDVLPTLLHLCGIDIPEWVEGQILPPWNNPPTDRPIYALEAKENSRFLPLERATFALLRDEHKLIHYTGYEGFDGVSEYYSLHTDPHELDNRFGKNETSKELLHELQQTISRVNEKISASK